MGIAKGRLNPVQLSQVAMLFFNKYIWIVLFLSPLLCWASRYRNSYRRALDMLAEMYP